MSAHRGGSTLARSDVFEVVEGNDVDAGLIAIAIPGRLEVEVEGLPPAALEKLRFWLDRPQGSSEELELVDGILRSHDLAPGTWTIKMAENELYLRGHDALVSSGETTHVEVEVERAYPLQLDCSFARAGWSKATFEARDDEGELLEAQVCFPAFFQSTSLVRFHLPQGTTKLEARTDDGQHAAIEIDVGPALFGAEPFKLALQ